MIGVFWKSSVVDPFNPGISMQKFSHSPAVLHVSLNSQRHGLDPLKEQKSAERGKNRARGPLVNASATRDVSRLFEMICVHQAVIRLVGLSKHRKPLPVVFP